jgi:hypothetical protein
LDVVAISSGAACKRFPHSKHEAVNKYVAKALNFPWGMPLI